MEYMNKERQEEERRKESRCRKDCEGKGMERKEMRLR